MSCRQFLFRTICLFVCLLSSALVSAQDSKPFRVDSYIPEKFTDLEWRVDGRFDANGTSAEDDQSYFSGQEYGLSRLEESRDQLRLNGYSTLRYTFLTQPRFFNCQVNFEPTWTRDANSSEDGFQSDNLETRAWSKRAKNSEQNAYALNGTIRLAGGQYFARDFFLQASAMSSAGYQATYHDVYDESESQTFHQIDDSIIYRYTEFKSSEVTSDRKRYQITGEAAIGYGRMHIGEYAATSLMIVEVLRENGLLDEEPSYEQLFELTRRIYDLRRRYSVDDRLRRIEALQDVIGFLQGEKLIGPLNARQALLIQDVWDYYPRNKRMFGTQIQVGYGYYYSLTSQQSGISWREGQFDTRDYLDSAGVIDTTLNEFSSGYSYFHDKRDEGQSYLYVKIDHLRPLNTHWHLSLWGFARYYMNEDNASSPVFATESASLSPAISDEVSSTDPSYSDHYAIEGNADIEWLVDSRTSFSFGASLSYTNLFMERTYQYYDSYYDSLFTATDTREESRRDLGISSTFNYRLSIPTTFTMNLTVQNRRTTYKYNLENDSNYSNWNYRLSVALQHYLF